MWSPTGGDPRGSEANDVGNGVVSKVGNGTDVVVVDNRLASMAAGPIVSHLNVNNSSKIHVGPKIVSVTQNVQNAEMIKELPLSVYLWDIVKNSSRTERLSCAAALIVLITCITLIIYFSLPSTAQSSSGEDSSPHEWNITREMWMSAPYNDSNILDKFQPLMLVLVQHTVSSECIKFSKCAAQIRNLQNYFLSDSKYNIPYNFLIGNDGRVYEGRGWNKEGAHTYGYNRCSLGLGFIGDYREEREYHSKVTELQLNRTRMLLDYGVTMGYLRPDFLIVGAKDVQITASPGSNLYNALQNFENYDHEKRFRGLNCEQIQEKYGGVTFNVP